MKRLIASLIDIFICFIVFIFLRFTFAIFQRMILNTKKIQKIYDYLDFVVEPQVAVLIFLLICLLYYLWANKKKCGITVGKKITGVTVEENWIGKGWVVCHIILREIAILLFPITLIYFLFFGKMPYDRILGLHIVNDKVFGNKFVIWINRVIVSGLIISIVFFIGLYGVIFIPCIIPYAVWSTVEVIAATYTATIDLPISYVGENVINYQDEDGICEYIFSEEGGKRNWAFTVTDKEQYIEEYELQGYGLEELEHFNFEDNFLVCTFGRKLTDVRIMDGWDEFSLYPLLVLSNKYEKGIVYYYCIPRIEVMITDEYQMQQGGSGKLQVGGTNYHNLDMGYVQSPMIETKGPLGRWKWACQMVFSSI